MPGLFFALVRGVGDGLLAEKGAEPPGRTAGPDQAGRAMTFSLRWVMRVLASLLRTAMP